MPTNPLLRIKEHGQSIWLDNLTRSMVNGGGLKKLIDEDGLSGVTSNPAIFNKAMTRGTDYDDQIRALAERGKSAVEIYEAMAIEDVRGACDLLRPTFDASGGTDGFVSLEVSPHLARDTRGTFGEAQRLWNEVDRKNLFIKIPGTVEGLPAIEHCLTEGININITLLFSLEAYQRVMEAHLKAMEARRDRKRDLDEVASVASFFLSRIDTKVDKLLDDMKGTEREHAAVVLRGAAAIASAKVAYQMWKKTYSSDRWKKLEALGGRIQKPLWASTSTKDPLYSDVKYVEPLIGPQTVNTLPDQTIEAFRDHGRVADTLEKDLDSQREALMSLEKLGISLVRVTDELVEEGVAKFSEPFDALIEALEEKRRTLAAT